MNKTVELKLCPFCGGKAILNASHSVECINACICPVIPRTWTYDTDEEAIEAWNHRIPTVDAISKDQYEARLKADMVAMLDELDLQIDEIGAYNLEVAKVQKLIRDKINALKENKDETDKSNK